MDLLLITVIAVVAMALIFDFTNGFHDAANSVATVVATRALPARWAPAFSAAFNFLAYFVVGTAVANTVAKTVKAEFGGVALAFAALFAAVAWNYVTWRFGMPSSSSHAIIGGLVGAGLAAGGLDAIDWGSVEKAQSPPPVRRRSSQRMTVAEAARRLREAGVTIKPKMTLVQIDKDGGWFQSDGQRQLIPADTIVLAAGMRPTNDLVRTLEGKAAKLYTIGDCAEVANIRRAIEGGTRIAEEL